MGYDANITRAEDWAENTGREILPEDWRAIVDRDPAFEPRGATDAVWTQHPEGFEVWFGYSGGNVVVKNPDEAILRKMCEVAAALGARVQGDEGEIYLPDGRIVMDDDHVSGAGEARWDAPVAPKSWWRRLFGS